MAKTEQEIIFEKLKKGCADDAVSQKNSAAGQEGDVFSVLHNTIDFLQHNNGLNYYAPMPGSGLKLKLKKVFRKLGAGIGLPLTQQQTQVNMNVSKCLLELAILVEKMQNRIELLEADRARSTHTDG